jgi:hypothetical protein
MIPARLFLALLLVLAGGVAFAQQSNTNATASCANPPCPSNLVWPGLGDPPAVPGRAPGAGGTDPASLGDVCRHMSAEERRKHPLTCGTAEPDAGTGSPPPAKSP